jgi:hypothetical protein
MSFLESYPDIFQAVAEQVAEDFLRKGRMSIASESQGFGGSATWIPGAWRNDLRAILEKEARLWRG